MASPENGKKQSPGRMNNGLAQRIRIKGTTPQCPQPTQFSDINQFLLEVRREIGLCLAKFKMQQRYILSPDYLSKSTDMINKIQRNLSAWTAGLKIQAKEWETEKMSLIKSIMLFLQKKTYKQVSSEYRDLHSKSSQLCDSGMRELKTLYAEINHSSSPRSKPTGSLSFKNFVSFQTNSKPAVCRSYLSCSLLLN